MKLWAVSFLFFPLFFDLSVSLAPPSNRQNCKKGHGRPKRRRRCDDGYPGTPDSLALPELRLRAGRRQTGHIGKCEVEWGAAPDSYQDLAGDWGAMPLESIANKGAS